MNKSNYNYVVIDDDLNVCQSIKKRMLKFSNWSCSGLLVSVTESIKVISEEKPSLIFLDWSIKGGNAFTILNMIESYDNYFPYIIFFTGYQSDHPEIPVEIINKYKVNRYLIKPVFEDLTKNLMLYVSEAEAQSNANSSKNYFWITTITKQKVKVLKNQIVCVSQSRANPRNKMVHLSDNSVFECKTNWEICERIARKHHFDYFIANSRDTMINKKFITKIQKPYIWLNNSIKVHVAKDRWKFFE
ncbi:MAG: response regulator [Flavobacteriales bacterium]|nr:response regulator [Flavobacteriales bacterium]